MKRLSNHERLLPLRRVLVVLFVVVAAAFAHGSVLAYWTNTVLLDTTTFMDAVEPVVHDGGVREQASATISDAVLDVIDIRQITGSLPPGLDLPVLEQLAAGFDSVVQQTVESAVGTDTFANLWLDEMRRWHIGLVGAVRAADEEYVTEGTVMRVALGPYIDLLVEQIDNRLVRRIVTDLVPDSARQMRVVVFDATLIADRLETIRTLYRVRPYLPWAAAGALLLAFVAAPRARHALVGAGVALVVVGLIARVVAGREAVRIEGLVRSTFSASEESAAHFAGALFGPLHTWIGYLMLAGVAAVVVAGVMMVGGRRNPARQPSIGD